MPTDKPLISILMAVYEPRLDWLREQLRSLDAQTYPNLRLYIRDDCSLTVPPADLEACVRSCITRFPYEIARNEHNLGSNQTFERLTEEAEGDYFAYCDQDDIWLPEKLSVLQECMSDPAVELACSDVQVIDGNGRRIADSMAKVRHRHHFLSGKEEAFRYLLTRNFAIGCTMLVRRGTAQRAVPFLPGMVHDHWLALYSASQGQVFSLKRPLIRYRIHGGNQTGVLVGISTRQEYIACRVIGFDKRIRQIGQRFPQAPYIDTVRQWAQARVDFAVARKPGAARSLWRLRSVNRATTLFELFALKAPEPVFRQALRIARRSG